MYGRSLNKDDLARIFCFENNELKENGKPQIGINTAKINFSIWETKATCNTSQGYGTLAFNNLEVDKTDVIILLEEYPFSLLKCIQSHRNIRFGGKSGIGMAIVKNYHEDSSWHAITYAAGHVLPCNDSEVSHSAKAVQAITHSPKSKSMQANC